MMAYGSTHLIPAYYSFIDPEGWNAE